MRSIFKTTDGGVHWEAISPDLTRNDKSKQGPSGESITIDDTGTEISTPFRVAESAVAKGLIWVGTDDGLVQVTHDGGKTWANVTPKDFRNGAASARSKHRRSMPELRTSPSTAIRTDDLRPYIFKTTITARLGRAELTEFPDKTSYGLCAKSQETRPALCGHRTRGLRFLQWRRGVAGLCSRICRMSQFTISS